MSIEKVKYVVSKDDLKEVINEFKLILNHDNLQTHDVIIENDNIIIDIYYKENRYFSPSYRVFGKIRNDDVYFGRVQLIDGMYDEIDVYEEFYTNGEIMDFR